VAGIAPDRPQLDEIPAQVERFWHSLPKFPDGRIDYTHAPAAAVLDCYLCCGDRLLVLKRTREIDGLMEQWHVVSGYLDERVSLREKALAEILEETGFCRNNIRAMSALSPYAHPGEKNWCVYPVIAMVERPEAVHLNEEHSAYLWIDRTQAPKYLLPQVAAVLDDLCGISSGGG